MAFLNRMLRFARAWRAGPGHPPKAASAELWCRPATVLALRDRAQAPVCLAGWR
jgi:hypothetical protein